MSWNEAKSGRLIRKAADIMRDKGHNKGKLQDTNGSFCVRGAVNYAWSGNALITTNYEYDTAMIHVQLESGTDVVFAKALPAKKAKKQRNPEAVTALTDFRDFLYKNKMLGEFGLGVEHFNDSNDKDEVVRWMHRFADEMDPKK